MVSWIRFCGTGTCLAAPGAPVRADVRAGNGAPMKDLSGNTGERHALDWVARTLLYGTPAARSAAPQHDRAPEPFQFRSLPPARCRGARARRRSCGLWGSHERSFWQHGRAPRPGLGCQSASSWERRAASRQRVKVYIQVQGVKVYIQVHGVKVYIPVLGVHMCIHFGPW